MYAHVSYLFPILPRAWFSAACGPARVGSGRSTFITFPYRALGGSQGARRALAPRCCEPTNPPPHRATTQGILSNAAGGHSQFISRRAAQPSFLLVLSYGITVVGISATDGRARCKAKPVRQVPPLCPASDMGRFINCLNRQRSPVDWRRRGYVVILKR